MSKIPKKDEGMGMDITQVRKVIKNNLLRMTNIFQNLEGVNSSFVSNYDLRLVKNLHV